MARGLPSATHAITPSSPLSRRHLLLASAAALVASACERAGPDVTPEPDRRPTSPLAAHPRRGIWPEVYRRAPVETQEAYAYAATHREVLGYIPCYCGCVRDGHRDNFDCYVAQARVDGWVVLDTHGFG